MNNESRPIDNRLAQLIFAWCGVATILITGIGFWPAGLLPAGIEPGLTAEQIATMYRENTTGLRIAAFCTVGGAGTYLAFSAAIAAQLWRIESGAAPVLTFAQLAAGTATSFLFLIPGMFLAIAAFRPERAAEVTQALNDVAFLFFLMPYSIAMVQDLAAGLAILSDRRETPIFPRWLGFLSLWVFVGFAPAGLCAFFKIGPFAWNGLFVWWIPIGIFVAWCFAFTWGLIRAANRTYA